MPRLLRVTDLRRCLYWAAGGPTAAGPGEPSSARLGTLFHQIFAGLTGPDGTLNLVRPLDAADADLGAWRAGLLEHTYAWHVAPALAAHHSQLHGLTSEVLGFWQATQALVAWLAELMWEQRAAGRSPSAARAAIFQGHEVDAAVQLEDPSWSDTVVIEGRIDAVLRHPTSAAPCVVELKLGRAAAEADLCQAALYQLLLSGTPGAAASGTPADVAVLAFQPEPHETRVSAARLTEAHAALRALAGRLAGVAGAATRPPVAQAGETHAPETLPDHAPPAHGTAAPRGTDAPPASAPPLDGRRDDLRRGLIAAYREFDVNLRIDAPPLVGPTFVRFFAEPGRGVRVARLEQLAESVWTRLRTDQPPQVSVVRGRIAFDVQRPDRRTVTWAEVARALPARTPAGTSRFPVGLAVDGTLRWADLAAPENCHFLVAGTTGSGKSAWLRAMLAGLLARNPPAALRLVLIDPKRTAFRAFEGSAYLWRPVVCPPDTDAVGVLDELVAEMERRYPAFAAAGAEDLGAYNAGRARLPRLVCVCDEYADLLAERATRKEIEARLARLGAKARAAGIHLVFATQRPSRDVVRGVIDTNLVARVALKVVRPIESRLVLDHPGAATLLGHGDLLFRDLGDPVRLQAPLVTDDDLRPLLAG